jgi:hypothetical protein
LVKALARAFRVEAPAGERHLRLDQRDGRRGEVSGQADAAQEGKRQRTRALQRAKVDSAAAMVDAGFEQTV